MSELVTIKQALSNDVNQHDEVDQRFFQHLLLSNGSFKTTSPNRLDDVNACMLQFLNDRANPSILDVAVSSAISSLEWRMQLDEEGIKSHLTAADLTMCVRHFRCFGLDFLFEKGTEHLLQCDVLGAPFPSSSGMRWRNQVYKALRVLARPISRSGNEVLLANANAISCSASRDDFDLVELDIFKATQQLAGRHFDVVRAANILNKSYFSDDMLCNAVKELHGCLEDAGVLVVVSTNKQDENNGAIYRKSENQFVCLQDIGKGSEIDALICGGVS